MPTEYTYVTGPQISARADDHDTSGPAQLYLHGKVTMAHIDAGGFETDGSGTRYRLAIPTEGSNVKFAAMSRDLDSGEREVAVFAEEGMIIYGTVVEGDGKSIMHHWDLKKDVKGRFGKVVRVHNPRLPQLVAYGAVIEWWLA